MTDLFDKEAKATRALLEEESSLLIKLGLKIGEEPNDSQRIEVLDKLNEFAQKRLSPRLLEAIKSAQARAGNYPHPIDALEISRLMGLEPQERMFWEATHKPHVMRVRRPVLRD